MTDYRALCAELLAALEIQLDELRFNNRLCLRARAALAEPVPPADREVADPVIPCEYAGYLAAAYRNGFHAGYKHALTRLALAEPEPPADGEVAELVEWLRQEDGGIGRRATYSRIADLLSRLAPQPVPEGPSDHELTMTYAYVVAAALDYKRGPFKNEDAEAAQLAGLRAVLARWGQP